MLLEKRVDIWSNTPPIRVFLIPFGKENHKKESIRIIWSEDKWVFPMITKEHNVKNTFILTDNVGGVYHSNIEKGIGEKNIRINGEIQLSSHFQGLKNIHGTIYTVGNLRQVVRRDGIEAWSDISEPIQAEAKKRYLDSFESGNDIYETEFNCIDGDVLPKIQTSFPKNHAAV